MADADYCLSEAHQSLLWSAGCQSTDSPAAAFVAAFVKDAAAMQIPLYAPVVEETMVEVLHCQWRKSLPVDDWSILGYLGKRVAARIGVQVTWAPELVDRDLLGIGFHACREPALWYLAVPARSEIGIVLGTS